MSIFLSGGCFGCGPCGGKWNAAQAVHFWHGFEPFTSLVTCGRVCTGDPATSTPLYGGSKYLRRRVFVNLVQSQVNSRWIYDGLVWNFDSGSLTYSATHDVTTTINKYSGCQTQTGGVTETGPSGNGNIFDCNGDAVSGWFIAPYSGGVIGIVKPVNVWATLAYLCNSYACFDGNGTLYASGPTIAGNAPPGTLSEDVPSATHLGFRWSADSSFTSPTNPPGTPPTDSPAPGTVVCASVIYHFSVEVEIDLSMEHDYSMFVFDVETLLSNYNLQSTEWKDMPTCPSGWLAGPSSTAMPLLSYLGGCDADPDGTVVFSYVRGTDMSPIFLTWAGFDRFDVQGDSGYYTVQKWAMRQGKYKPWRWQDGFSKLWKFLLLQWTANFCTGEASFGCENKTGGEWFVFCVSPNADFPLGHNFWFSSTFLPERVAGNDRQMICKDAMADTYPDPSCAATPLVPFVAVEPVSCNDTCPDNVCCAPPGAGQCPPNVPDNFP